MGRRRSLDHISTAGPDIRNGALDAGRRRTENPLLDRQRQLLRYLDHHSESRIWDVANALDVQVDVIIGDVDDLRRVVRMVAEGESDDLAFITLRDGAGSA